MRVGLVQLTANASCEDNLRRVSGFVEDLAERGAELICLPENVNRIVPQHEIPANIEELDGPTLSALRRLAKFTGIHLLVGGIAIRSSEGRGTNSTFLLGPTGEVLARYDKIHLFDYVGKGVMESAHIEAGSTLVTVEALGARLGLATCYDLRFPELFRALTLRGAQVILLSAAFLEHTGKDHWEPLLRARAIENQVFLVACNQFGQHYKGRLSHGRSMIVSPWGEVLVRAEDRETSVLGIIDLAYQTQLRASLPVLEHVRADLFGDFGKERSEG
ncbi:MAG: hypothetical protein A2284_16970 [Deltaproteobacteria bacterium RIFOXYA12_FULL_61_11]|nr:MAG: hypothetical protein A2284_16970 [Deltaproteobacteria bacterium RIFOXYA12_FULL_61_11]